jgi:hypothetical protein
VPDKRSHRGPHPEDHALFAPDQWPELQAAVAHLAWLLSHDYALNSALKLVGNHFQLRERQRLAVMRSSCSEGSLARRREHHVAAETLAGKTLLLDGYNVLTTLEAALGGGVLLCGMDGCLRDMASMHGHYKRVAETAPALELLGQTLADRAVAQAHFLLDAPVSNSGRLKTILLELAAERHWPWTVTLVPDPDPVLAQSQDIIATADSIILDGTRNPHPQGAPRPSPRWTNLTGHIIARHIPAATIVPLATCAPAT